MGFFKKLFGISTEEETSNYNKSEHEDNTPQVKVETKSEKTTSKQSNNPNMTSWENFFGINLKESPNEDWTHIGTERDDDNIIRTFENYSINDPYFSNVSAHVLGSRATNFFFTCPYSWEDAFDIYFLIERDLVHNGNYTNTVAADKFRGTFDSVFDTLEWNIDGCYIRMSRDCDTGDIELGAWTTFYHKDYLDTFIEDECSQIQDGIVESDEIDSTLSQQTFNIHLSGALKTLQFVHDYMADQLAGSASCYIAQSEGDTIQLLDEESFKEMYSFQSSDIANYLNGRLGALGFKNFNCDNLTDIQAEVFVIPAGDSNEEEEPSDAFAHYEMSYLVDPINIDYRRKTITDGTMNLNLVGIQYRDNYDELMETLEEGMEVILKPEPANEFDPNALAFYYNDEVIGYLPKKDQPFARIFMANGQIKATIRNIVEQWIDTEVVITKDMIDFNAYENNSVRFTQVESFKGGNCRSKSIELSDFVETIE